MFSPEATIQSARGSQRNPRRRQRVKDDSDLQQQPRPKRQKSTPNDAHLNGNGSVTMNGHARHSDVEKSVVPVDMPVRERKAPTKRALRDDSALYLTKNENYSVKKLPGFPAALSQGSTPFRAFALPYSGLALALTSTQALAWDYNSSSGPARVLTLDLPFNLKSSDPLPLGAIVRNGPTNDFGILAIAPSTGKITFWENVDSAEARNQFAQRHQAVDGSVKVYSGEHITSLVDVDHAGYIVVFSSGRLVQLRLRDAQGRPRIATTALHAPTGSSGSFFSFKGLLGNAFRKSIASVKAHPSESKGQMEIIAATKNCLFQTWDLSWSGQQIFKYEVDVQAEILSTLQIGTPPEARGQQEAHILDFAVFDQQNSRESLHLLVLVALSGRGALDYSLLEVDLSHNAGSISRAIPIRNFQQAKLPKEPTGTLLLPQAGCTAFVQFPDAIVVASLAKPRESPDAQLLSDSGKPNLPFQDTIYLAKDRQDCFCGHASEIALKKDSPSSAVLFIKGYGIIQIKAMPPAKDEDDIGRHKVTAKSKLEQTTFFSTVPDNIIDFSIASRYSFALEDVEKAAVEISTGVLSSSYDYFEKATSSLDEQMNKRASALRVLISHLRKEYPPLKLDTTWQLLWDAEKLATAIALWNQYQETLQEQQAHPGAHSELLHLQVMIKYFHERTKTSWRPDLGETDPVRHFFLKEIGFMEHFLKGIWEAVQYLQARADAKDKGGAYRRMIQATDTALTAWETAFNFRAKNIEKYGLDPASFEGAILLPDQGQDLIPHFWTSTHNIVNVVRTLTAKVHKFTAELEKKPAPLEDGAMQLARDSPRLVQIVCQTHLERSRWAMAQTEEKTQETGKRVKEDFDKHVRPEFIYSLIDSGQAYEAMSLAEQYQDMATLARIVWNETVYLKGEKATTLSKMEQAECNVKLSKMKERIQRYFDQYGAGWAEEFYSRYIQENRSARVFDREYLNQAALTNFLRGSKSRARLAWINEVLGEQDYARAHKTLREVATTRETNVWCKKVELSIAKLSLLATKQASPSPEAKTIDERNTASDLASTTGQLKLIWIQEQLRDRFAPIITGALDDESAVELLMAEYGQGRLANRQAHQHLLRQGFDALIHNQVLDPALLIDVLTLMTYDEESAQPDITVGNEFAFALKVLVLSSDELHSNTQKNLLRLIWKRLAIKDDWAETNNTKDITDAQLEEFLLRTGVGTTFKTLLGMIATDSSHEAAKPPSVWKMLKAGCSHGELCSRFPSEDLRGPIIDDNIADDDILNEHLEKHKLEEWFGAALNAAQRAYDREQGGHVDHGQLSDGSVSEQEDDEEGEEEEPQTNGTNGVAAAQGGEDVEMQDQ